MPEKRKKTKNKTNISQNNSKKYVAKKIISAAVCALAVFFALMFAFSMLASKHEVSESIMSVLPFAACAVSGLVGGALVAKNITSKTLVTSLIGSLVQSVVICVVLLLTVDDLGLKTLLAFAVIYLSWALGAIWKMNRKPKRKI